MFATNFLPRRQGDALLLSCHHPPAGAVLPDHEHVKIEQTYMLEGTLVDKEGPVAGPSVGPGEFVWREAGTRHVAWTPEGGLMLAMFQVPNKFFEADGRVTRVFRDRARKADGGEPARTR